MKARNKPKTPRIERRTVFECLISEVDIEVGAPEVTDALSCLTVLAEINQCW